MNRRRFLGVIAAAPLAAKNPLAEKSPVRGVAISSTQDFPSVDLPPAHWTPKELAVLKRRGPVILNRRAPT